MTEYSFEKTIEPLIVDSKLQTTQKTIDAIKGFDQRELEILAFKLQEFIVSQKTDDTIVIRGFSLLFNKEQKDAEQQDAEVMGILKDADLFPNIIKEIGKKVEGEEKTRETIFLSLCSIWLNTSDIPINTLVNSESSAGKSFVCRRIYEIFPDHLKQYRTKVSPEAFTYWHNSNIEPEWNWDGKICYLEDIRDSLLNSDAFKLMCSEGSESTVVIRGKAVDIKVNGKPVMLITTAKAMPKSEIVNRFNLIECDETAQQTKNITAREARRRSSSIQQKIEYNPQIKKALGLLQRREVVIPFAEELHNYLIETNSFDRLRLRRDFPKLLDLICCSTVLHQFQRQSDNNGFLIASKGDYEIAKECIDNIQTSTFLSLTHRLRKAYECCRQLSSQIEEFPIFDKEGNPKDAVIIKGFSVSQIHNKYPDSNLKTWYTYLDELCERGLLMTTLEKIPTSKSKVTYFQIKEMNRFTLPEITELSFFTNNTILQTIQPYNLNNLTINPVVEGNDCKIVAIVTPNAHAKVKEEPIPQEKLA